MDSAGARGKAARWAAALWRPRSSSAMRALARDLGAALGGRPERPADVRELCRALCEEMGARRGGRRVELRFERFPDEIEVTGLCVEFHDFDLVIVEERAEASQQLVILGHELWHLHAGHRHHHGVGAAAAARALAGWGGSALAVAARNGSRQADEAQADDFGHRLAAAFRPLLAAEGPRPRTPLDPVQRSMGYRGRRSPRHRTARHPDQPGPAPADRGTPGPPRPEPHPAAPHPAPYAHRHPEACSGPYPDRQPGPSSGPPPVPHPDQGGSTTGTERGHGGPAR